MAYGNFLSNLGSQIKSVTGFANNVKSLAKEFQNFSNAPDWASQNRLGNDLPPGAENDVNSQYSLGDETTSSQAGDDWRVRIELPAINSWQNSALLQPLYTSSNSLIFPVTPQILIQHVANYSPMSPTHTNYAFPVYSNSNVEDITITCEWPVENENDGKYWVAAVHFLRSVTKMFYGASPLKGAPPPICYMHGYGDYIFKKMPIVVKMFSMDLNQDIDYIKVPLSSTESFTAFGDPTSSANYTYVPVLGRISVTVGPAYSRDEVRRFNLDTFTKTGQGGFI